MRAGAFGLLTSILLPGSALACTVCGAGDPDVSNNFLMSTIFLSLLPLFILFGGAGMLWWHAGMPSFSERPDPVVRR